MLDLLAHLSTAKYLPDLTPEVAYSVRPRFSYTAPRAVMPGVLVPRQQAIELRSARFARGKMLLSADVAGQEQQLVAYYKEVLGVLEKHRQQIQHHLEFFRVQPVLLSRGQVMFSFELPETYPDALRLLRALQKTTPTPGELYGSEGQGWEEVLYATPEHVYLAWGDGERSKPAQVYYTDRARLRELAAVPLARLQQQLALLVRETGQNPWRYEAPEKGADQRPKQR